MTPDVIEGGLAAFADGVDTHDHVVLCAALQVYGAALRDGRDVPRPLRRALAAASDDDLLEAYWLSEGSLWHEHLLVGWYRVRIAQGRPLGEGLPEPVSAARAARLASESSGPEQGRWAQPAGRPSPTRG